jgi:hypothetical protein
VPHPPDPSSEEDASLEAVPVEPDGDGHDGTPSQDGEPDWSPEDPEAWGGEDQGRDDEWQPESPETWEKAAASIRESPGAVPIPAPIRRSGYHRSQIRRTKPKLRRPRDPLSSLSRKDRKFRDRHGYDWRRRRRRRIVMWGFIVFGLLLVGSAAAVADAYYESYKIYRDVKGIVPSLTVARKSLAEGRIPTGDPFAIATQVAQRAQSEVHHAGFAFKFTGALPFFKRPIEAVKHGVAAADLEAQAATLMRDMVRDVLGDVAEGDASFSTEASDTPVFSDGVANVDLITGLAPRLETVIQRLMEADQELRAVPTFPYIHKLDEIKADALEESAQAIKLAQDVLDGVRLLPSFLGAGGTKTYYLAMQNNADQRATGGDVLAYAFITITDGKLDLVEGGGIGQIDIGSGFKDAKLPPELSWYFDHLPTTVVRLANLNLSPNFPVVASAWSGLIKERTGRQIDGAIAMDPVAISYLLGKRKIEVPAYPGPISGNNVVAAVENDQYRLEYQQQRQFPAQLIAAAWEIFKDPKPLVRTMRMMGQALREKHIQIWSVDQEQEGLLAKLGWDGGLTVGPGDYLYVTDSKRVSNKVDFYTRTAIDYQVTVDATGAIHSTCKVTLANDSPTDESRFIIGDNGGLNRALLSVYSASGSTLESSQPEKGAPVHEEGGAVVFVRTIDVLAGESGSVAFTYSAPGVVTATPSGRLYRLTIQHQPLVNPADLLVTVTLPPGITVLQAPGWTVVDNVATYQGTLTKDLVLEIVY